MKEKTSVLLSQGSFIFLCGMGGLLLSLFGISIGWMIGSLVAASILSLSQPKRLAICIKKGIDRRWFLAGQYLLGIELGRNVNMAVMSVFQDNWLTVIIVLLSSVLFALGTGWLLYRYSSVDALTSLLATAPGGIATMPTIAEEVKANIGVVSAVQTIRVFSVVTIIPVVLFLFLQGNEQKINLASNGAVSSSTIQFEWPQFLWTFPILLVAFVGVWIGKRIKLPAPWVLGSLVGVILVEMLSLGFVNHVVTFWWPHPIVVIGQILIGASIGSRFQKSMFIGLKRILIVGTIGTLLLISAMFLCAYIVSVTTGISLVTSVLAFAPGGVVEMSTAAVLLHADSTFVVAVQTLRIVVVILLLPPFIKFVHQRNAVEKEKVKTSSM
ncbi:MAG TPA: AbrB family transcriptional regulator [Bacillus bacterium]|nr:AbrB family transcriptional regulator [Bacillus sp. (in: firmicutes)]